MESQTLRHCRTATNIDLISDDLLHNILSRLPATSFASAACVSRSWNLVCGRLLSRPKLSSAYSLNPSLQAAVEEVVNKVLSEPIRPHFAIVSIGGHFDDGLGEAHRLITAALGTHVPVITNLTDGIIERNADSNQLYKVDCYHEDEEIDAIMLIVGFLPGLKATLIPLLKQIQEPETFMIDEFVSDIREFSTSVSGRSSPAAIIMFCDYCACMEGVIDIGCLGIILWIFNKEPETFMIDEFVSDIREFSTSVSGRSSPAAIIMFCDYCACMEGVIDKLDYAMSPETVIVGDTSSNFRCTNDTQFGTSAAVALVFAVDRNKPPGIGETQFHAVLSSGLSPVGPTYTSVVEKIGFATNIAARREGSVENIDAETILNQIDDELGGRNQYDDLFIGVTKRRKYSIGKEKVGCMTSLAFHPVRGRSQGHFVVLGGGLKTGDTFRFYYSTFTTALSSAAAVSSHLKSFNQGSNSTALGGKLEVFGGLIFTCPDIFGILGGPDVNSSPFSDNFPGVTLGGNFSSRVIGRRVLTKYVKESWEQKALRCSVHVNCSVYLILSYTSLK